MPPPNPEHGIPFLNLAPQHDGLTSDLLVEVQSIAESQHFINGEAVARFESAFAHWLGSRFAVGVSSGTDALLISLMELGVGPGDEVITTPFTFFATVGVIARLGARPVFADVSPDTLVTPAPAIGERMTTRTRAVIPVHLYGWPCDMQAIMALAEQKGVAVIEDCAQSLGATWDKRLVGTYGRTGAFSFFPTKNLGAWGDAGMVVTDHAQRAERIRQLRDHGASERDFYPQLGGNFRLDTLQAAVLAAKLRRLDEWLGQRRQLARQYREALESERLIDESGGGLNSDIHLVAAGRADDQRHAFNLFVIRTARRDALRSHLARQGVATGVYYTRPLHLQPCFDKLGYRPGDFPFAEQAAAEVLALPFYPGLPADHIRRVVRAIASFFKE